MQKRTFKEYNSLHVHTKLVLSYTFSLTHTHTHDLSTPALCMFPLSLSFFSPTVKGVHAAAAKTNKCVPSHRRAPQKAVNATR